MAYQNDTSASGPSPVRFQRQPVDQDGALFRKDCTSYFDISPSRGGSLESNSTSEISPGSPGAQLQQDSHSTTRPSYFRFYSEALHKRVPNHATNIDRQSAGASAPGLRSPPSEVTFTPKPATGRSAQHPSLQSSRRSSATSAKTSPLWGSRPSKDSHTYSVQRPKLRRVLATSSSWIRSIKEKEDSADSTRKLSSAGSEAQTSTGDIIVVRTDQTPLKPPSKSIPATDRSTPSSIKVETDFGENIPSGRAQSRAHSLGEQGQTTSRRGSINPKTILTHPLHYIRYASLPKRAKTPTATKTPRPTPIARDTLLPDHTSQLKRNYTSEVLQRAAGILQEIKHAPQNALWPPQVLKPLRWRTFSDKSLSQQTKKEPRTVQGIISEIGNSNKGSGESPSAVQSYTSSVRNLQMGIVPTNTPSETATYKVKRSPSAETEEYLKVDISIRGGTSYLPSEARRIHTPPLPEEGADGRWRGFFFDYNAPGRTVALPRTESLEGGAGSSGSTSQDSNTTSAHSRTTPPGKKPERIKSRNRRILKGDWYDVKLAEVDMDIEPDRGEMSHAKQGDRRVNSPKCLSKIRKLLHDADQFDLTIPEHLPSSPLCPRHPRYWRVAKGRGIQFRGCWMHGLGVFETESENSK
ncbi:uncharacterized protein Z520_10767 [Fonsecaea multimorphosa CBS 102226]|uniref:Uncharacterized protein n=1 Tax=Fonsecaea multimorphosa CBS 102226 TaxID=1442371 RepID=A0A0D2JSW9_9EURO|nr:uncharacterized protein Z520_10767 [Fonsecaea multimorphosa CBS 102226]KIX93589.1 hypothetical protein Z520_10767 [Fonsecaea multimorphosa CBS 102226]OAL18901.1 hypothetical protein AYO22_10230 [Fonsecaea multimorphosa]